jgi:hypothetical protein
MSSRRFITKDSLLRMRCPPSVARSARLRAAQVDSNDHFMNHVVVFGGFFSLDLCLD